jgi:hypothetical protein
MIKCMLDNYSICSKNDCLMHVDPTFYIKYSLMIMMLCFFILLLFLLCLGF